MVVSSTVLVSTGSCLILLKCNVLVLTDMTQLGWSKNGVKKSSRSTKNRQKFLDLNFHMSALGTITSIDMVIKGSHAQLHPAPPTTMIIF